MPNHVFNNVFMSGDKDSIKMCASLLATPYVVAHEDWFFKDDKKKKYQVALRKEPFSFWNIISPDPDLLEEYFTQRKSKVTVPPDDPTWWSETMKEHNESNFWYSWNVRYWGTKWDAYDVSCDTEFDMRYSFTTAWSPVTNLIERLSSMFPDITFMYDYEEETGWGGSYTIINGSIASKEEWDTPASHADYINRDRECICDHAPSDIRFDDCPEPQLAAASEQPTATDNTEKDN